jgi:hypothetical protein
MPEHPLDAVNLTELLQIAKESGVVVGRQAPREEIYALLDSAKPDGYCPLEKKRLKMEAHILRYFRRLRTQLPGCNGKCSSFGCPDIIVHRCWLGFRTDML